MKHNAFSIAAIAIGVVVNTVVATHDTPPEKPRLTKQLLYDAFSVFTLTIAQDHSLDSIQVKYPDLRDQVLECRISFERAFRDAVDATDVCLRKKFGAEWDQRKKAINQAVKEIDNSALTRTDALAYIETVNRRAKGKMPQRIYTVLAALHPEYLKHPHLEFARGYTREYNSDGSGKAAGLKLAFQYPMSWEESEGRRPHIVRKFTTHDSFASAMLIVKKLPQATANMPLVDTLSYLSSKEYLEAELPDAVFVSNGTTTIASQPSSFVDFTRTLSRALGGTRIEIRTRGRIYFLIYLGTMVGLSVDVTDTEGRSNEYIEREFKRRETLFDLMALDLDIYNRYP